MWLLLDLESLIIMFHFWTSPNKSRQLLSDDELESSKRNDEYIQKKRILDVLSYSVSIMIIFLVGFTFFLIFTNENFRNNIAEIIRSEFKPIIYAVLAIFGVNILNRR